jgi:hypothetical protein
VSQAFCSALPVSFTGNPAIEWQPFGQLVLEAAYEATLLAGLLNVSRGGASVVFLTRLGGGAFGNAENWIDAAMRRALDLCRDRALDIRLVGYSPAPPSMLDMAAGFA